jgi:predicted outer membrane repeat protein
MFDLRSLFTARPNRSRRSRVQSRSSRVRPVLETLEDRLAPAIINVLSTADNNGPVTGGRNDTFNAPSLRSAISFANATPGNNTINLLVGGTYKITLPGANEDNNATGDFDILGKAGGGDLTIQNMSGTKVTVNGNHLDRVFDINPNFDFNNPLARPKFTVTLIGFTVTGGVAQPGDGAAGSGGGIRDQGNASLVLTNVVITGNTATADGGGISMENAISTPWTLTLNNTVVSNNHAGDAGGGIDEDGSGKVIINGGALSGNTAVNQGAGIWLDAVQVGDVFQTASLKMTGTLVNNNRALGAGGVGGGIGNAGNGAVTIMNSTVMDNFAGATGGGFGDENGQGSLTVVNSTFLNNTAVGDGGGIAAGGPATSIITSEIDDNFSGGNGGGLFANGTTLDVQNSTLANNIASNGGGIELETTGAGLFKGSTITNTTLTGNLALNNASGNGGGIDLAPTFTGDLKLMNDTIDANSATNGGGLFWAGAGNVGVQNTIIAGNFAAVAPDVSTNELFTANLTGAQEVPPGTSPGTGTATIVFNPDQGTITVSLSTTDLTGSITAQELHVGAAGANGPVALDADGATIDLGTANPTSASFNVNNAAPQQFVTQLEAGHVYVNVHTSAFPNGEIRGQFTRVQGSFLDLGGNLIGVTGTGSANTIAADGTTQTGTATSPLDALLGMLQNNGGPTIGAPGHAMTLQTQAPQNGSLAIGNGIFLGAPLTDARGLPSVVDGQLNAGAVSGAVVHLAKVHHHSRD